MSSTFDKFRKYAARAVARGRGAARARPGGWSVRTNLCRRFDPVVDELRRWQGLGLTDYGSFRDAKGLLNEFAMVFSLRQAFPLHYIVFRQTACHLPHEANVEQIFSRAGLLSDPNLDPDYLAVLVKVGYRLVDPPARCHLDQGQVL